MGADRFIYARGFLLEIRPPWSPENTARADETDQNPPFSLGDETVPSKRGPESSLRSGGSVGDETGPIEKWSRAATLYTTQG